MIIIILKYHIAILNVKHIAYYYLFILIIYKGAVNWIHLEVSTFETQKYLR